MSKIRLFYCLTSVTTLLGACIVIQADEKPKPPSNYEKIAYEELTFEELDQSLLADPGMIGCNLSDLPPFGWKTVDSGIADVRTPEDYALQIGSLYQEGFRYYLDNRIAFPDTYQSIPEMNYEEFLETCNVFPDVDFTQHSVLGYHTVGTGCTVTFEKRVYRDDQNRVILYELTIIEEGACEMDYRDRNLILVPRIPLDYVVEFSTFNVP